MGEAGAATQPGEDTVPAYQLRVVLRGVSPLVWRRLLVRADSSVADLHAVLQVVFGWDDDHLHRFVIHGVEYGSCPNRPRVSVPPSSWTSTKIEWNLTVDQAEVDALRSMLTGCPA